MKYKNRKGEILESKQHIKTLCLILVIAMTAVLAACKTENVSRRADNEEKVLRAMTEYPGSGLYDPEIVFIGLDAPEPSEEELSETEQKAAEEKQAWKDAVGSCFADGMFDNFYSNWARIHVLGTANICGLTTTMISFGIEDDADQSSDNIEHAKITVTATDENSKTQSFDMDWRVIFDKDNHDLIQKIELIDDGGFYDEYAYDGFDITSGLSVTEDEEQGTRTIETDYFRLTLGNYEAWWYQRDSDNRITIYNTTAYDAGLGGRVFSIETWDDLDSEPFSGAIPYKSLGIRDGKLIAVTYASDVQYDFNSKEASDEYMSIRNEAEMIQEGGKSGPLIMK